MSLAQIATKTTLKKSSQVMVTWLKRPGLNRQYCTPAGTSGSGSSKGGAGGSIKEAGGGMGRLATAQEEGYFYQQEMEKLKKLKKELSEKTENLNKPK